MANSIACVRNYKSVLDEVYKRTACSTCLSSPRRMALAGRNAKEIMVPKIEVTGLGGLHAQRRLQDGLDHLRVRDQDVQLRPRHQVARGRDGRQGFLGHKGKDGNRFSHPLRHANE